MSGKSLSWAMAQTCGGPINKFVLLTIADSHHPEVEDFSIDIHRLAEECEMLPAEIERVLRDLVSRGLLFEMPQRHGVSCHGEVPEIYGCDLILDDDIRQIVLRGKK